MLEDSFVNNIIGIAGASRSGKDTLCKAFIRVLKREFDLIGVRKSLAGDLIKSDLYDILYKNLKIDPFTEKTEEKNIIRPLLVEYGKLMRNKTKGRYFLDNFSPKSNAINIIPDIRYDEYEKDEVYWLKNEVNGVLIFIERENILDANISELKNNKTIKEIADFHIKWSSLDEKIEEDRTIIDEYAYDILKNINLPLSDRASLCF
jgi:hypothetical protein